MASRLMPVFDALLSLFFQEWMAPEVLEGLAYNESADGTVHLLGFILIFWESLYETNLNRNVLFFSLFIWNRSLWTSHTWTSFPWQVQYLHPSSHSFHTNRKVVNHKLSITSVTSITSITSSSLMTSITSVTSMYINPVARDHISHINHINHSH